jgi:2-dehydro-3-deoxyphosphogluconate aldolase/(4S)-4-hydroxy-2-oxoglutarate aldolase
VVSGRDAGPAGDADPFAVIAACGVVPVVRLPRVELAVPLAETLRDAGLACLEVTFRAAGAAEAIRSIRRAVPDVLVGAGTVLTVRQAAEALDAGATFIVAPGTSPAVVESVLAAGAAMLPGVATPSEIEANLGRGLSTMKLFPAEVLGGAAFLRAVHGPYPAVRFVPTGGISAANLADYLALPNVAAVGGTWIAPSDRLEAGDLDAVARAAAEAVAIVVAARGSASAGGPAQRGSVR